MKITLVRHGETDWNKNKRLMGQLDIPLNETGREQAKVLKAKLANTHFDCCYSSPLSRARETAEIICDGKCPILFDDNLKERFGGEMEGKLIDNWDEYDNNPTTETDAALLARAKNFLDTIKKTNYDSILVVSHNGLLKKLRYAILGKPDQVDWNAGNLLNGGSETYEI